MANGLKKQYRPHNKRLHPTAHTRQVPELLSRGHRRSGRGRCASQPGQRVNRDVMHQGDAATNEHKSIRLHRNQPGWVHRQE